MNMVEVLVILSPKRKSIIYNFQFTAAVKNISQFVQASALCTRLVDDNLSAFVVM